MQDLIHSYFDEGGRLAKALPGYKCRPAQIEMAGLVAEVIGSGGRAVVEAATGTGKTLAYLVPAVLSGKKTLVSTATKNLQEQIFYKDIPFLKELGMSVSAAYLKGRSNYLCKFRFDDFKRAPLFRSDDDAKHFAAILKWAERTETGDRAELADLPDDFPSWYDMSTSSESCLGTECRQFNDCFVTKVRRRAAQAQILVVNHHLFFADLAVRAGGFGEVLPDVEVVIFDEAHHLEDTATNFFGRTMSPFRIRELRSDLERAMRELNGKAGPLQERMASAQLATDALFSTLARRVGRRERAELPPEVAEDTTVRAALKQADDALGRLGRGIEATTPLGEVAVALARRCNDIRSDLEFVISRPDSAWVYFTELRGRRRDTLYLQACPIDLGPVFNELLYPRHKTTVFTSATLAVAGAFHYFRSRIALGVDEPVAELRLQSGFDYMSQAILYVPQELPEPSAPSFADEITPTIESLLGITGGRAFVLFTSYRNLRRCHELLKDRLPYRLLMQGERSRSALLESFRDEPSVLMATASFWEGVDVPGENLSLVIIDKLPFASPADPVVKARIDYIREQGGEPFRNFQLPEAAISLKQGFGRLIRHHTDRGIVAILDRRLLERAYGRVFLNTLPRTRRTRDLELVKRWWARGH